MRFLTRLRESGRLKMKTIRMKKLFHFLLALICCAGMTSSTVYAEEPAAEIEIPVSTVFTSTSQTVGRTEQIVFLIDPIDNAPLPEETTIALRPSQKGSFGPVEITAPGTYRYIVTPLLPDDSSITLVDDSEQIVQIEAYQKADGSIQALVEGYPDLDSAIKHSGKQDLLWQINAGLTVPINEPVTGSKGDSSSNAIVIESNPAPFSALSLISLCCIALGLMWYMKKQKEK